MSLTISINDEARSWIEKKGGFLTVKTLKAAGCCGGGPIELATDFGKPEDVNFFEEITLDNLTIFVQKGIPTKDNQLTLKLSGIGFFKHITALGISRF
ncbi:Fe-S oxidoreductase [Anaerobacillus alkaliphilus]|uniref:Fe-S oxidoreductase n=1 Tax=Anaerobacillus alkaliphilus TaxID=1548597 RepID=A0A4Q0VNB0_9BACI|nr:CC/Se motif family (seleno)protein [Anaerobacillus alkaliphilus]RXI97793.1 Fe-S oxidoreductase [Anaerobacillus alkaliphilus]